MSELTLGNCVDCKFAQEIAKSHWRRQYYKYFCKRFPPTPAIASAEIWTSHATVNGKDSCWEFQPK